MAILSSQPGPVRGRRWHVLAILSMALAAGCALVFGGEPPFAFSHRLHVAEGLECADCHAGAQDTDQPGMPAQSQCALCHQDIDAKKPPERQIATLFDGAGYRAARANRLDAEVLFSHQKHVASAKECAACHTGIETNDVVEPHASITMSVCVACHTQQKAPNECASCHSEIRAERAPASHAFGWQRLHGLAYRAHNSATMDRCSLCHEESTCASCHLEVPPSNHNNYFRLRGHGVHARMDRQNCAACHRSDSCDACHADARPINHVGSWGSPVDTHCISCHFPLGSSDCATCHRDTPSHAEATTLPPDHTPGMNCRQCHGLSAPLPHVDNGSECTRCHR
jgi:hypothetical protein